MANDSAHIEIGYGSSSQNHAYAAGEHAARQALEGISIRPLTAVFVFTSVCYDLSELFAGIVRIVGDVPILGSTTAGEICNGARTNSVLVIALASPYLHLHGGLGRHVSADWQRAVRQAIETDVLSPYFSGHDSPIWADLTRQGKSVFGLIFTPGNTRHADSRSFEILEMLKKRSAARIPFLGGASADDWNMETNAVFWENNVYSDSLLVVVFETSLRIGISIGHGFTPSDRQAVATAVGEHEVIRLDGQPAADRYAELLGYSREALNGKHLTLTTGQTVGITGRLGQHYINVASYFSAQGGVRFAQPVGRGSSLTLMAASPDRLIQAGRETLRKAMVRGSIHHPAVAFVFSCALRTRFMRERFPEEISGMKKLLPHTPLLGFYSFGEQGVSDAGVSIHGNGMIAALVIGNELSVAAEVAEANKRLLEKQQAAERKLHLQASMLAAIQDTILVISPEMQTLWCNQAAQAFFGDREEMFTEPCYSFYKHRSEPCEDCPAIRAMATGRTHQAISQSFDKNDRPVWRLTRAHPYCDESQRIAGAIEVVSDYSEQKRMQDALQSSELTLKKAQTVAGVGSWSLDIVDNVLNWSDETYRLFGVEKKTPLTVATFIRCVHPDNRHAVANAWRAALKGATYDIEHRIIVGNEERWVHEKARITFDADDQPMQAIGTSQDITAVKRYEQLIQAERDLGAAWSGARTFHDRLNCCLEVAIRVASMDCGGIYLVDESDGSLCLTVHQGLPDEFLRQAMHYTADSENARLVSKGRPVYALHRDSMSGRHRDSASDFFQTIGIIPVLFKSQVVACLNIASHSLEQIPEHSREVLERIAQYAGSFIGREIQEEKNRQSRRNLDMLFNTIEDMLFIVDKNGCIIQCNQNAIDKLGYSSEELIGRPIVALHPPDRHAELQTVIAAMLSGEVDTCSIPLKTRHGFLISVETKAKIGLWDGQKAIFGICRDITERIRMEEQRQQTVKAESLACMAGAIAHHFNNTLTAVIGNLDLLRVDLPAGSDMGESLGRAEVAARRATEMSRRMLTILGQIHSRPETIDLARMCGNHLKNNTHTLPAGIGMEANFPDTGPLIKGDPLLLAQILDILLANAIEVLNGESGKIRVAVDVMGAKAIQEHNRFPVHWQPSADMYACLTVRDTGKGMEQGKIGRIFDPFYSDKFLGRGMGLAMALGITKSLNGCIQVRSAPGQGSQFRVFLPLVKASA